MTRSRGQCRRAGSGVTHSMPEADELDDGFAVKYLDANNDQQLYYGADRAATNGTKDAGFWFFHQTIATGDPQFGECCTGPSPEHTPRPSTPARTTDSAMRTPERDDPRGGTAKEQPAESPVPACDPTTTTTPSGDVLILTTFTGGGAITTVRMCSSGSGRQAPWLPCFQRGVQGGLRPSGSGAQDAVRDGEQHHRRDGPWSYDGKGEPVDDEISSRRPPRGRDQPLRPRPGGLLLELHGHDPLLGHAHRGPQGLHPRRLRGLRHRA